MAPPKRPFPGDHVPVKRPSWLTLALAGVAAFSLGALLAERGAPAAHAQASEGKSEGLIALTSISAGESLLYLVDTRREVILVYAYHQPGRGTSGDVRSGAFEFLAGRLFRWDALLASKHEYSLKGIESLEGLRVLGKDSAKDLYERSNR